MTTLYLDCGYGISGDMTLAALIDMGADLAYLTTYLEKLPLDPFAMETVSVVKQGITARTLKLQIPSRQKGDGHRHAADILQMIRESQLPSRVKERSIAVFEAIAEAEGKIHGIPPDRVHFHEVGAMDSIIDVIGVCLSLEYLGVDEIVASPVPTGHGKVRMAHGLYPLPAPATTELLKGIPLAELDVEGELTTPTGAAFLKALVQEFSPIGGFTVETIGYGAGTMDFPHPNVLRALQVRRTDPAVIPEEREPIWVLECQVDDMSGEGIGYCMERLFAAGALDVYHTPVQMKKNRPGTLLTVLASAGQADACEEILLLETTTLGVRRTSWFRKVLQRETVETETPFGSIRIKVAYRHGKPVKAAPEYEDVAHAARTHGVPFHRVADAAMAAYGSRV